MLFHPVFPNIWTLQVSLRTLSQPWRPHSPYHWVNLFGWEYSGAFWSHLYQSAALFRRWCSGWWGHVWSHCISILSAAQGAGHQYALSSFVRLVWCKEDAVPMGWTESLSCPTLNLLMCWSPAHSGSIVGYRAFKVVTEVKGNHKGWGPNQIWLVSLQEEKGNPGMGTQRNAMQRQQAGTFCKLSREAAGESSHIFHSLILDFNLHNCEKIHFCCFSHPAKCAGCAVMAIWENGYSHLLDYTGLDSSPSSAMTSCTSFNLSKLWCPILSKSNSASPLRMWWGWN